MSIHPDDLPSPGFKDIPEEIRQFFPKGMADLGGGKSAVELDDSFIENIKASHAYCAGSVERALAVVQNIKDNGGGFYECWGGFLTLTQKLDHMDNDHARILFAYALAVAVFGQETPDA